MAVKKVQKAEDVKVETPVVDETPEVTVPENVKRILNKAGLLSPL